MATQGHICLHAPQRRFLLSGDHLLDPVTETISHLELLHASGLVQREVDDGRIVYGHALWLSAR
jgi:glyoxylase-like metal-dependent hydrolase (beta-lactamase superfamily II)